MSSAEYERFGELADREAAGEALSGDQVEFLARFAAEDGGAAAEVAFWNSLAELDGPDDEVGARRLADSAVKAVLATRVGSRRRRTAGFAASAALAAAAALWFSARPHADGSSVAPVSGPTARLELSEGSVYAAGAPLSLGARLPKGAEIEARGGAACVALESTIHVCLASGARVRLSEFGGSQRRVDLLTGRVAAALAPLPSGEHFSVVAGPAWSTAVGTAFTVERRADGAVETVVHEGKVKVGGETSGEVVPGHRIGLVRAGAATVEALGGHARTETAEWRALGRVAGRSVEATLEVDAAVSSAVASIPGPSVNSRSPRSNDAAAARRAPPVEVEEEAVSATPGSLLAEARQALREQRWAGAASSYRKLVSTFPGSAEANTVLVPLAGLEIDRLGQPGAALTHLDTYLGVGGPLVMEARLARIRAYRVLGRAADEARAIGEFLSAHPNALDVAKLRERRDALRPR